MTPLSKDYARRNTSFMQEQEYYETIIMMVMVKVMVYGGCGDDDGSS